MKTTITFITSFLLSVVLMGQDTVNDHIDEMNRLLETQKYEQAIEYISAAIETMPDSVELYEVRGFVLEALGRYQESIQDYNMAIDKVKDPEFKSGLLAVRAGVKSRIRDYKGAYNDCTESLKINPNNLAALNNIAAVCDEVGKPEETLKYLHQIIAIDSTYIPAYVNIGFKYQVMNKHEEAIAYFDKIVDLSPNEPLAYSNRSFSKLKIGKLKEALLDIDKSIALYPTNAYAYKVRALIKIEKKQVEAACEDLLTAQKLGYLERFGEEVDELLARYCR